MSDHNEKINEFRAGDVVRVVVVAVDSLQEQLSVSFRRFRLPRESKCLKLVRMVILVKMCLHCCFIHAVV